MGKNHGSWLPHIGLNCWSLNVGVPHDMRWGGDMETPSEAPLVNGLYSAACAHGRQQPDSTGVEQATPANAQRYGGDTRGAPCMPLR